MKRKSSGPGKPRRRSFRLHKRNFPQFTVLPLARWTVPTFLEEEWVMRRTLWITPVVVAAALAAVFLCKPHSSPADPPIAVAAPAPASRSVAPQLPVSQVVLFSSGVGYFQREGE